jgi:hypothetical protein
MTGRIRTLTAGWPRWAAPAAAVWTAAYGLLGLYWAVGGAGFPFAEHDDAVHAGALLVGMPAGPSGLVIAVLAVAGLAAMPALSRPSAVPNRAALAVAVGLTVVLIGVATDARVLVVVAGALILNFDHIDWPALNQIVCVAGGLLWGAAALVHHRTALGRCAHCGGSAARGDGGRRWGVIATYVAIAVPLFYAVTRWAWAAGLEIGVTEEFLNEGGYNTPGARFAEFLLGAMAAGGAALTLGLVRPWGERFPRRLPCLGGRRVPPALAIVPATMAAALLTAGGLALIRGMIAMMLGLTPREPVAAAANWGASLPPLLWLVWGLALAAATAAYHRRRSHCAHCSPPPEPGSARTREAGRLPMA